MSKDADIKQFVPGGTSLKCSYCSQSGITPVKLMGGNPAISIYGEPMMTEKDMIVGTNIVGTFPTCGAPKNTFKICSPVVTKPWVKNADPQITSNKNELLVNDSYVLCDTYFGEISPVMDDPIDITEPKKDEEDNDLPIIENPIDALKEKMNGVVDAVKKKLEKFQEQLGTDLEELFKDVTAPLATVLNKPGVKSTIEDLQGIAGKAEKYKTKADDLVNSPEAAKEKLSNKILGTEQEEESAEEPDENENKSIQERINDGIGGISKEVEAYKQEMESEEDENFVVEGLSNILGSMNESLSEFRTHFTEAFKPPANTSKETDSNIEGNTPEDKESISDKAKEEYDDIKEYREEHKAYKKEAEAKFDKYAAKLKETGYDVSGKKGDVVKAIMLLNWLDDKNAPPQVEQVSTSGPGNNAKEKKTEETTKQKKTSTKKKPGKVRTRVNTEVTGYIDEKLLESGLTEDIKEAKEDLADAQKDIDRAKKYLTVASNFNASITAVKDAVMGRIGSEIGEDFAKVTKKQEYLANYMNMGSSALEVSKFALSGFATSPGSVITKVDDGRGKDTDDDPASDDFGNFAQDIHGGRFGIGSGAGSGSGNKNATEPKDETENDQNLEPKILRLFVTDLKKKELEKSATVAPDTELLLVIQANGKADGETARVDLKEQLNHCVIMDKKYKETADGIYEITNINGASPDFEKGEGYDKDDSGKTTNGKTLSDKTYIKIKMVQPENEESV